MIRHKFNAVRTEVNGVTYASKKEAKYAQDLALAKKAGSLLFFLRQVPFHLPGGVVYRVDFQEFWANGEVRFTDVKGFRHPIFILKKKQVEELYAPVKILEV